MALALFASGFTAAPREVEVGPKMAEDCTMLLDQLLGPGRAKVIVRVQGEQSEVKTQIELLTPAPSSSAAKPTSPIPGFGIYPFLDKEKEMLQRDQEQSTRTGPFLIKKIEAFVVIDQGLPAPQWAAAGLLQP